MPSTFFFAPHAPDGALAHLVACIAIAERLRERGHRVAFAYGGSRPELLDAAELEWHPVPEVGGPMIGEWYSEPEEMLEPIRARVSLIGELRADAIIASSGAGAEAAIASATPSLILYHALHSTKQTRRVVAPWVLKDDIRHPTRLIGDALNLANPGRRVRRRIYREMAALRETYSSEPPPHLALTTAPQIDPARSLSERSSYVGPIIYDPPGSEGALPAAGDGPRAYVSQGSTGSADLLERCATELLESGFEDVIVSTGGLCEPERLGRLAPQVRAADMHDSAAELAAADVAVIAGGHMTSMAALTAGVPTIVIPAILGHIPSARRVERLGVGKGLWPRARPGAIGRAARRLLSESRVRERATGLAASLRDDWDGAANAAALAARIAR